MGWSSTVSDPSASSLVAQTTPAAPTGLTAVANSVNEVYLNWNPITTAP